ncbi:Uncharacterized protein K02A2.6 [Araneus ventricosus]|uniref:RNA-directed DNA polymerase n=1 Tax=Araneus ventricosus TaxID=182803 RepID=A0A4Y2A0Q9_ARAVE|nr:Uncharacterized protein K02A2.6 [Araneus ventricosus]
MKEEILQNPYSAHREITSCINKASRNVYLPNFYEDIKKFVNSCSICQQHQRVNVKETLLPYRVPSLPWEEVSIYFMYLQKTDYLLCTDYHSKCIEIKKLSLKTAEPVISALEQVLRTHGIPRRLHSDNGPPFDCKQFVNFTKTYDIEHVTSSPKYPKSNGMVKRAIGTMQAILHKVIKDGGDPILAVLEYNTTPKFNLLSPAEMLMGRVFITILPTKSSLLKPKFPTDITVKRLKDNQSKQKAYYDKTAVKLSPLKPKKHVYVQMGHRDWTSGSVLKKLDTPRSYLVKTFEGSELRRNRIHLRPDKNRNNSPENCN